SQSSGQQSGREQPGPRADLNDGIAGAQATALAGGVDQLLRVAAALAVVVLGDVVEDQRVSAPQLAVVDAVSVRDQRDYAAGGSGSEGSRDHNPASMRWPCLRWVDRMTPSRRYPQRSATRSEARFSTSMIR